MTSDREQLTRSMAAMERGHAVDLPREPRWAVLAGLGSKYLAIGSPDSLGIIECGASAAWIAACHEILFGGLKLRVAGRNLLDSGTPALSCSIEEALACDIVCLPWDLEFDLLWIAEATHLNLRYQGAGPSSGSLSVFERAAVTLETPHQMDFPQLHGSLEEVITGQVSGRMGDELTVLLHD